MSPEVVYHGANVQPLLRVEENDVDIQIKDDDDDVKRQHVNQNGHNESRLIRVRIYADIRRYIISSLR